MIASTIAFLTLSTIASISDLTHVKVIVTQDGRPFADYQQKLLSGTTSRYYRGDDGANGTTVWLTPSPENQGWRKLHIAIERVWTDSAKHALKASSDVVLNSDHGWLRVELPAAADKGATEISLVLGIGAAPHLSGAPAT